AIANYLAEGACEKEVDRSPGRFWMSCGLEPHRSCERGHSSGGVYAIMLPGLRMPWFFRRMPMVWAMGLSYAGDAVHPVGLVCRRSVTGKNDNPSQARESSPVCEGVANQPQGLRP